MKSIVIKTFIVALSFSSLFILSGCLKGEFDTPPTGGSDPEIPADQIVSLTEVMSKYYVAGKYTAIDLDKYVKGVVVADDRSGNFYKTLIVEDENSDLGIAVLIDENEIHSTYPVGKRVFIKLKGLTVSDYNGLPQLGMGVDNSGSSPRLGYIPSSLMSEILVQGAFGLEVKPRIKKISELSSADLNTLIQLEGVQFSNVGADKKYANNTVDPPVTINQDLVDCFNNKIIVRNSGYADFANEVLPDKNGTLTAVYSIFRADKQLFIRDTKDVAFDKVRCGGGNPTGSRISIESVRTAFANGATSAPTGFIQGIVISDVASGNITNQNLTVQDGDYGIVLRFKNQINIPQNTEIKIDVSGAKLEEFSKLLQINDLDNSKAEVLSTKVQTPKTVTVGQLDVAKYESTLVKVVNAQLTGGPKYSGTVKVKDASGEVQLFTRTAATFSGQNIPSGTISVTAILSEFTSGIQLSIRNLTDIEGGAPCDVNNATADCDGDGVANGQDCSPSNKDIYPGAPCDDANAATVNDKYNAQCICEGSAPGAGLDESFNSQTNNVDITLSGWVNVAVKGTRKWQAKLFSGNLYAQATSFNDTAPAMETWLITPEVNTAVTPTLTFETAKAFWVHDGLSVWATSNYTGDPATTTWTKVNGKVAVKDDADNTFIPSGNVDLKSFGAKVKIGFKYEGAGGTNTSTFRVDNVVVK
ncbi:MAG: choice-of-anchor J domain-containing protein [Saprospiraceae bacterium]|nr:choice-of-anchor J domain-containing protein [Saprospiraceae bacterium]